MLLERIRHSHLHGQTVPQYKDSIRSVLEYSQHVLRHWRLINCCDRSMHELKVPLTHRALMLSRQVSPFKILTACLEALKAACALARDWGSSATSLQLSLEGGKNLGREKLSGGKNGWKTQPVGGKWIKKEMADFHKTLWLERNIEVLEV